MSKTGGRYCVVYNSSTVGEKSYLAGRFAKRKDADHDAKVRNRTAGMGGFFSAHECSKLGWQAKRDLGLLSESEEGLPHHATKKTPAQLQREIDEALARRETEDERRARIANIEYSARPYTERYPHTFKFAKKGGTRAHSLRQKEEEQLSFAEALQAWLDDPSRQTADQYRRVARTYHEDGLITDRLLGEVISETAGYYAGW